MPAKICINKGSFVNFNAVFVRFTRYCSKKFFVKFVMEYKRRKIRLFYALLFLCAKSLKKLISKAIKPKKMPVMIASMLCSVSKLAYYSVFRLFCAFNGYICKKIFCDIILYFIQGYNMTRLKYTIANIAINLAIAFIAFYLIVSFSPLA
jgi:hypothetical protein